MVVYDPRSWFALIFQFHKAETFRTLFWVLVSLAGYTFIVIYIELEMMQIDFRSTTIVHSLLGFVISLLLVFRTNTAYDRWWEGRKQWGALVNVSRNLTFKVNAFIPEEDRQLKTEIVEMIAAYPLILKDHLRFERMEVLSAHLPDFMKKPDRARHVPNYLANEMQAKILKLYRNHKISESAYLSLLNDLNKFTDIMGACERILKTPIPYTYNIFIKKFIFVYIITLPFGFVTDFGYWTILINVFIFYTLASLELIAEEIENPFGLDSNDLPTDDIAVMIGKNVREITAD